MTVAFRKLREVLETLPQFAVAHMCRKGCLLLERPLLRATKSPRSSLSFCLPVCKAMSWRRLDNI